VGGKLARRASDGTSIGLVMIVRNEARVLPRLARSVKGQVDHVTIVDTGSRDGTVDVAKKVFADVPLEIVEDEWRGFGESRNVAMRRAEPHTDWLLFLDADEALGGRIDRTSLAPDYDGLYVARLSGPLLMWLPRIVASGRGWSWHGRTHEYLKRQGTSARTTRLAGCRIVHHGDGGSRADKYERDLELLRTDWAEHTDDVRTAFYLARTYDDMGRYDEAVNWYQRRASLGGWDEEAWYATFRLGVCLLKAGLIERGRDQLWSAWAQRRHRAEPLATLAEHFRLCGAWPQAWRVCTSAFESTAARPDGIDAPMPDSLFVDTEVYAWRIAYEASITAWYAGEHAKGKRYTDYVLGCPEVPDVVRDAVRANQSFYD
jgi:tetratricopeptide (TPR) repeat protein